MPKSPATSNDTPVKPFRCKQDLWDAALAATAAQGTTNSAVMRAALESFVKKHPVEPTEG